MFGTKIRSWMEAHIVRPRKKQHRKETSSKKRSENGIGKDATEISQSSLPETNISSTINSISVLESTMVNSRSSKTVLSTDQARGQYQRQNNNTNLSSPESAYSTGYSTDGTSPGTSFPAVTPAPEYYINIRTGTRYFHSSTSDVPLRLLLPAGQQATATAAAATAVTATVETSTTTRVASPLLTSPRQRNRIRTNPWVSTTTNTNCNCSPLHVAVARQSILNQQPPVPGKRTNVLAATASPVRRKWSCDKKQRCMKCGACSRFEAFSSSSSSSLSVSSVHRAVVRQNTLVVSDDEDDRTLNEMMGKYDESYVYEKETDILSDSDPTDCDEDYDDTDVDAGREGGDERDPLTDEDDFDFIDNGSLEFNIGDDGNFVNMGHCTYHSFIDEPSTLVPRRRESGKTAVLRRAGGAGGSGNIPQSSRRRKPSERRSRHASSKKRRDRQPFQVGSPFSDQFNGAIPLPVLPPIPARARVFPGHLDGSRSAGATPVSVRRKRAAFAEQTSPIFSRSVDKPRRNSISHARRRLPTDAKLLEVDKEADKKYRELIIEAEHILMAMRTSSPPVSGSPARRANVGPTNKRVELLRNEECGGSPIGNGTTNTADVLKTSQVTCLTSSVVGSVKSSPKKNHITNFINSNAPMSVPIPSPAAQRKLVAALGSPRRTPMVTFKPTLEDLHRHCPQSEPVKRKVYSPVDETPKGFGGFAKLNSHEAPTDGPQAHGNGNPVFQRQKLFHTITSLKKNLENQSETLRHAYHYGSNQRLTVATKHL